MEVLIIKKTNVLLIIGILLTLFILSCIIYKPFYYRVYIGYRIKGNISVTVDNEVYLLEKDKISLSDSGKISINDNGTADILFHAGKYGNYEFNLLGIPTEKTVTVNCFQHNWWNVQKFEINVRIDTSANTIHYTGYYSYISDSGNKTYEKIDKTQSLNESKHELLFGM